VRSLDGHEVDYNLAAVEADLALRRAPAVADAASAATVRRAGKLLRVLAQHLLDGPDPRRTADLDGGPGRGLAWPPPLKSTQTA
jgi:hypothetical protein